MRDPDWDDIIREKVPAHQSQVIYPRRFTRYASGFISWYKTKKSTEDSVIYLLGNPQRDVGDWLTLINKLDTIATYSIPTLTATCLTMRAHAYTPAGQKCRHTEQNIKINK